MNRVGNPLFGMAARHMPASLEAEKALLGGLLANNRALSGVEEFLRADHFADPINGMIYQIVVDASARGRVVDTVTLKAMLENSGDLAEAGGTEYLASLLSAMVSPSYVKQYGEVIRDTWARRELIDGLSRGIDAAFNPPDGGAEAVMEEVETCLLRVSEGFGDTTPAMQFSTAIRQAVEGAREAAARVSPLAGITTGYAALDRMTGGLRQGQMILLGARPSMGKTGLGLGIGARAAAAGHHVLMWSGEMAAPQLGARAAAAHAWLPTLSVFTGRGYDVPEDVHAGAVRPLTDWEWRDLERAEACAARLNLVIDTRGGITVAQLRARARRMKRTKGLDLLIVDYVGLMRGTPEVRRRGKYEEISEISAHLKMLAMELEIPVLALAQMSRANETRDDKRPMMSDLRDSGGLEQDADVIAFLYREHYYLSRRGPDGRRDRESDADFANRVSAHTARTEAARGKAEVIFAKQRQGPVGTTRLRFTDFTTWFHDESEPDRAPAWPEI